MKLREQMPALDGATAWLNSHPIKKVNLIGNKPTFIHYWSVSCGLCKETMAKVNELRDVYKNDLNVIAVHMPRSEKDLDLDQIKEVALEYDITQPIFIDSNHKLTDAFDNQYVPAYYIFDTECRLRHYQAGSGGMRMLKRRIDIVLG